MITCSVELDLDLIACSRSRDTFTLNCQLCKTHHGRTNTGRPWSHVESHRGVEGADKHDTRDHGHVHDQLTILHVYASTSRARRACPLSPAMSPAPPTARGTARAARPPRSFLTHTLRTTLLTSPPPSRSRRPRCPRTKINCKPSSTPAAQARACYRYASRMGSCKVCVAERAVTVP